MHSVIILDHLALNKLVQVVSRESGGGTDKLSYIF